MSDINYEFIKLRKKRRRLLLTSGLIVMLVVPSLLFIFLVGNPFADSTKYKSCNYNEVVNELMHFDPSYKLPVKSSIPLENVFAINFKNGYHTLFSHAITHPRGERAGDFVKDRCRFLVEQALAYRSSDDSLLSKEMVIMLVNEGNFKDLSTQIIVKGVKFCLGVAGNGNLKDFKEVEKKIMFYKGSCGEFLKNNFYTKVEDDKIVVFPPENKNNGINGMDNGDGSPGEQPVNQNGSTVDEVVKGGTNVENG